jgi:hypothetical protein
MDFNFENKNELTRQEFEKAVKFNGWEVFSSKEVKDYGLGIASVIEKGIDSELSDEQKQFINIGREEIKNLKPISVVDESLVKSLYYVQDPQIKFEDTFEKSTDGSNVMKGIFLNTSLNRTLNRVGDFFMKGKSKKVADDEDYKKTYDSEMYKAYTDIKGSKKDENNDMYKAMKEKYSDMDEKTYKSIEKAYNQSMYKSTMEKAEGYKKKFEVEVEEKNEKKESED